MEQLARKIDKLGLAVRQFQDFTPTPGTLSTAMFVTGLDRDSGKPLHVARGAAERRQQRQVLEKLRGRGREGKESGGTTAGSGKSARPRTKK
jgi:hypothetical protein